MRASGAGMRDESERCGWRDEGGMGYGEMRDAGAHIVDALVARRSELNVHAVSHPAMRSPFISALFTKSSTATNNSCRQA